MRRPGKDFPDMLQKPSTLSVSSWLYIDFEAKIMALSESLLLLTGFCFWKNTYVFPRKHVRVFCKSRTCFLDKVMVFLMC